MRCEARIGIASAFLLIFLIGVALDRPAQAETVVSIEVIRSDGERRQLAPEREQRITTNARSIAVIRYASDSIVFVTPNSVVRAGSIFVEFGEILVKAKGLFRVDTRFVIAGSEGTEYSVRVKARDDVSVAVVEGKVSCQSKKLRWPEFVLDAGEIAYFEGQDFPRADRVSDAEIATLKRKLTELERLASPP
jgi:ferric-dicitrate binding protein FerR (iron transport regulator)